MHTYFVHMHPFHKISKIKSQPDDFIPHLTDKTREIYLFLCIPSWLLHRRLILYIRIVVSVYANAIRQQADKSVTSLHT